VTEPTVRLPIDDEATISPPYNSRGDVVALKTVPLRSVGVNG
jgi:hypothetical protein